VSSELQLACGEPRLDELRLQRGVFWARWRLVHSVRGRKVQGVDRNCHLLGLRGRDVLYSSRGLSKLDMQRLSVKLQLA
jgi:hypothetical protein